MVKKRISRLISSICESASKFNETIHGDADAAAKTVQHVKSLSSGMMAARGVRDCIVSYQSNDMVCLTVSVVGTTADVSNMICGKIPGLKNLTPFTFATFVSSGCKFFVHLWRTGSVTLPSKNPS